MEKDFFLVTQPTSFTLAYLFGILIVARLALDRFYQFFQSFYIQKYNTFT